MWEECPGRNLERFAKEGQEVEEALSLAFLESDDSSSSVRDEYFPHVWNRCPYSKGQNLYFDFLNQKKKIVPEATHSSYNRKATWKKEQVSLNL